MVRVALDRRDGTLRVDRSAPGRGAWLCAGPVPGTLAPGCTAEAVRRHAFSRAFRTTVDDGAMASLRESTQERGRMESGGAATATGQRRD
jgi:predicted RNA-binding protein YlxR (DUF448 family)